MRLLPLKKGNHRHRCSSGHVWQHPDRFSGNVESHLCPECGEESWWKYFPYAKQQLDLDSKTRRRWKLVKNV